MIYFQIFWAFFISNLLGYGGGPAIIPLIEQEVVQTYGWMTTTEFSEVLAVANSLPGPIATKMAGYIGFEVGGVIGAVLALFATIAPSVILLIAFLQLMNRFKDAPQVKKMTENVKPTIAVMLGALGIGFFMSSFENSGLIHTLVLFLAAGVLLVKTKIPPVFVIVASMLYGALLLS